MKFIKDSVLFVLTLTLAVGFASCSQLRKLDEMGTATIEMGAKVDSTSVNTDAMNTNMTQGASLQSRNENLVLMNATESMSGKLFHAAAFNQALEFQLRQGVDRSAKKKGHLLDSALNEFFARSGDFTNLFGDLDTAPTSTDNKMKNLYALVATMSRVNANNESDSAASIRDVIEEVLKSREALWSKGDAIEAYQRTVLKYERQAIYMLQMRSNFLPVLVLGVITSMGDEDTFLPPAVKKILAFLGVDYERKSNILTSYLVDDLAASINDATRIHLLLKEIGEVPTPDSKTLKVLCKLKELPYVDSQTKNSAAINQAIAKLNSAIHIYVDTVSADL